MNNRLIIILYYIILLRMIENTYKSITSQNEVGKNGNNRFIDLFLLQYSVLIDQWKPKAMKCEIAKVPVNSEGSRRGVFSSISARSAGHLSPISRTSHSVEVETGKQDAFAVSHLSARRPNGKWQIRLRLRLLCIFPLHHIHMPWRWKMICVHACS